MTTYETHEFRGDLYNPIYGVDVSPMYYRSVTDEDGFRNNSPINASDIVVLGDSFAEVGHDEYDTFSKRLEVISGYKTKNLGLGWYGPFQYLSVFERYGLKQEPKYALFCFFEGNDIGDIHEYLKWKEGGDYWNALKEILRRFKVVSSLNRVIPIVVFIPSTVHIYAPYSVLPSGARWLKIRDAQISSKSNTETAVMRLLAQVGIRTISLTASFEEAANKGRFLYYDFDTHWNSEGREIAASYVAAKLAAFSKDPEGLANARP